MNTSKLFVGACASLVLLGAGCIPSPKSLVENAVENKINADLGTDGSVDLKDDGVSFTNNEDGTASSFGSNVTIPDNFPKDVPIVDGAIVSGVTVAADQGAWIAFGTTKPVAEVISWYDAKLAADGWKVSTTYAAEGASTKSYVKDSATIGVIVTAGEDGEPTSVMLTRTSE